MDRIDVTNDQLVGAKGNGEDLDVIVMMPRARMSREEALRHAAWLVAIADDPGEPKFPAILEAVRNT